MKRWIALFLCIFMAWGLTVPVFSETEDEAQSESVAAEEEENDKEKKEKKKEKPKDFSSIVAPHAIVVDLESGYILFEKDSTEQAYPGDLVKLMTALIVAEQCDMNDIVTVSQTVLDSIDIYVNTSIELEAGEQASVKDLLYAMLLPSADDAAIALAEHVAGDEGTFVEQMNQKAKELGMNDTVFTNASGIFDEGQYTTAKDMAILSRAVMSHDLLAKAVGTDVFEFSATNTRPEPSTYFNKNYLVSAYITPDYFYDNALGLKNGYTEEGQYTLSAAASNGVGEVLCVVMGNERDEETDEITSFNDCITVFDYVFDHYSYTTVINTNQIIAEYDVPNAKGDGHVLLLCPTTKESFLPNTFSPEDVTFNVNLNRELKAPITKGEVLGTAEVVYNNQIISTIELVSDRDLTRSLFKKLGFLKYVGLFIVLLFLAMLLMRAYNMNKRKKRKKRLNAQRAKLEERSRRTQSAEPKREIPVRKTDTEYRRQAALERTTRNLERSARLTSDRAKMRADARLSRELERRRMDEERSRRED